jgi:hypothetical protein
LEFFFIYYFLSKTTNRAKEISEGLNKLEEKEIEVK